MYKLKHINCQGLEAPPGAARRSRGAAPGKKRKEKKEKKADTLEKTWYNKHTQQQKTEKKTMKLIIAGDRNYYDTYTAHRYIDHILSRTDINTVEFISGGYRGADKIGEAYARKHGKEPRIFEANWQLLGGHAGPARNEQMAQVGTHLIAFLRPGSRGTRDMINRAKAHNLKIAIFNIR